VNPCDKIAEIIPPYIEQFSEEKVIEMLVLQVTDFLSAQYNISIVNENLRP